MDIEERKLKARWKKAHLILIIVIIGMVFLISLIFAFNPIVIVLGILGSIASIIGITKDLTPPKSIEDKLEKISKKLENFAPLERDRLIQELKEKNEFLETALKDERAGNSKERKEALNALKKGNPTKAQELFKRRIEKDKVNLAENYLNLGNAYFVDLRFDEALEAFNKAIEFKPDYHEAWYNKGNSLAALGRRDEALEAYNKAIEIKPDDHEAWYNLACLYSLKKEKGKALKYFQKAIDKGFNDFSLIMKDNDLDFIRNEKEFKEIISILKKRHNR